MSHAVPSVCIGTIFLRRSIYGLAIRGAAALPCTGGWASTRLA